MILRNFIIAFQAEIVYNNDCSAKAEQSDMRLWRNWQTRKTKEEIALQTLEIVEISRVFLFSTRKIISCFYGSYMRWENEKN